MSSVRLPEILSFIGRACVRAGPVSRILCDLLPHLRAERTHDCEIQIRFFETLDGRRGDLLLSSVSF